MISSAPVFQAGMLESSWRAAGSEGIAVDVSVSSGLASDWAIALDNFNPMVG